MSTPWDPGTTFSIMMGSVGSSCRILLVFVSPTRAFGPSPNRMCWSSVPEGQSSGEKGEVQVPIFIDWLVLSLFWRDCNQQRPRYVRALAKSWIEDLRSELDAAINGVNSELEVGF